VTSATGSLTDVGGLRVGHWTDADAATGCTVVLLPAGTVASGEIRGGAPGTREWAVLDPGRLVDTVDVIALCGGSAFGLAACDGVMDFCRERGIGFPTSAGPVPIVVGAVIYDLGVGDALAHPGPTEGRAACEAAGDGPVEQGRVGAGTGATVGNWRGPDAVRPGGVGSVSVRHHDLVVAALAVVNAYGDVVLPGSRPPDVDLDATTLTGPPLRESTTLVVVATNAALDKAQCRLVAQAGQDGLARTIVPAHTQADGDATIAAATGPVDAAVGVVRTLAVRAVEGAVAAAVQSGGTSLRQ